MNLYTLLTPWNPLVNFRYTGAGINSSSIIAKRIRELRKLEPTNITDAYRLFLQVTCGYGRSWHMVYVTLWSCLEFIFRPSIGSGKPYYKNLADRVVPFLVFFDNPESIQKSLVGEYRKRRHQRIHGLTPFTSPNTFTSTNDLQINNGTNPIGLLHEVARLSLLLFMNLSDDLIVEHFTLKKNQITDWFTELDFSNLEIGKNQRAFIDEKSWMKENFTPLGLSHE